MCAKYTLLSLHNEIFTLNICTLKNPESTALKVNWSQQMEANSTITAQDEIFWSLSSNYIVHTDLQNR